MSDNRQYRYHALISYSHADTRWAKRFRKSLERFKIDKDLVGRQMPTGRIPKSLYPVFRDRDEFTAGRALSEQTIAALNASAALIVICSPNGAQSRHVNEEVRLFKANLRGRPLVPIIVDGQPGDIDQECFPPALRFLVDSDGAITDQPAEELLAADVRREADGWGLALAKVVASLLALETEEVFRRARHARRQRRRLQIGTGIILFALLFCGALFGWLNHQKQQTIAEIEALIAKYSIVSQAQGTGTGTTFNLAEAIAAIVEGAATDPRYKQALDLLKAGRPAEAEVLLRAVAEDLAVRSGRVSKEAAGAYRHLGAIAGLGDPRRAREAYARAIELDPNDSESLYWSGFLNLLAGNLIPSEHSLNLLMDLSIKTNSSRDLYRAHLRLGEVDMARGDLTRSKEHQLKALGIAESIASTDPASSEWQRDYSVSLEKIGDVLQSQGDLSEALQSYQASVAVGDGLLRTAPNNAEWQRDLSVSYDKLGDVLKAQLNLTDALENYQASFIIRERLAAHDPANAGWQRDLSVSHEKIGEVMAARRDLGAALNRFETALTIRDLLARSDPGNATWQHDVSIAKEKIGDVLQAQGNAGAALANYKASFAIRDRLVKADATNAIWQRDLSVSHNKIGDALRSSGKLPEALTSFEASFAIRDRLAKADPANATRQVDLALSFARLGQIYAALDNKQEALRRFKVGREIIAPLAERSGNKLWQRYLDDFDIDIDKLER
jgi:tetratricopeptide (TPR) repeat protein